jgi:hypothetical protein
LRFFDEPISDPAYPNIGGSLFDISSFLGNLTTWCFLVFVVVSLAYTLLPPKWGGEQTDEWHGAGIFRS